MKNKVKWYLVMSVMCVVCVHCTRYDEYKKYMEGGEIVYPQKADSVKTYPGKNRIQLEWEIVDPRVTSCKVFYEHGGIQRSTTVSVLDFENDTIRVIISDLEETNHLFKIVSYDDFDNSSITVEAEDLAYGELYERALINRTQKSAVFDESEGLQIEWYKADVAEIDIRLAYTDIDGNSRTMKVSNSETSTTIPDFDVREPLFYSTTYKPVPAAIDTFYAQTVEQRIAYWANISHVLNNTVAPFTRGAMVLNNRFFLAEGWTANDAAAINGSVDANKNSSLVLWTWTGTSPTDVMVNGKLYQTVELDAGIYRFNATIHETSAVIGLGYVVAASSNDLPNIDVISQSLASVRVPAGVASGAASKPTLSVEFVLTEKTNVSLGFVVDISGRQEILFSRVELWEQR